MMKSLHAILRPLHISWAGAREAVMAVAERVALRVQSVKCQFQIEEVEARLRQAYETLGQAFYSTRGSRLSEEAALPDSIVPLRQTIRNEQRSLHDLRTRLVSQDSDSRLSSLIQLQEELAACNGSVDRVTIGPSARSQDKSLSDIPLPEGACIVLIRRGGGLIFPSGRFVLRAGDQVTLIGTKSALPIALEMLNS